MSPSTCGLVVSFQRVVEPIHFLRNSSRLARPLVDLWFYFKVWLNPSTLWTTIFQIILCPTILGSIFFNYPF